MTGVSFLHLGGSRVVWVVPVRQPPVTKLTDWLDIARPEKARYVAFLQFQGDHVRHSKRNVFPVGQLFATVLNPGSPYVRLLPGHIKER